MATVSQLPTTLNIDVFGGASSTVTVPLGVNISGLTMVAYADVPGGSGVQSIPVSVVSAQQGTVSLSFSSLFTNTLAGVGRPVSWQLRSIGLSSEDPVDLVRTLRWGVIRTTTQQTVSPESPLYLAIQMVEGDEYTFQVNLGVDLSGLTIVASTFFDGAQQVPNFLTTVVSAPLGIVKITVDEQVSSMAAFLSADSWSLRGFSGNGDVTVFRAGPFMCYRSNQQPAVAESVAAQGVQLGLVFL